VVIPEYPELFSVMGLMAADSVYEEMQMLWWTRAEGSNERLREVVRVLEEEPRRQLKNQGYLPSEIHSTRSTNFRTSS
jgi:hypothetical protein